jgi:hypothetical protein
MKASKQQSDIDLLDTQVLSAQRTNVRQFASKRKRLWFVFLGTLAYMPVSSVVLRALVGGNYETYAPYVIGIPFALGVLLCIPTMLAFKCPSCQTIPPGRGFSFGSGPSASYSIGVNPYPRKCIKCGSYLAMSALLRDLERQKSNSRRPNAEAGSRHSAT